MLGRVMKGREKRREKRWLEREVRQAGREGRDSEDMKGFGEYRWRGKGEFKDLGNG